MLAVAVAALVVLSACGDSSSKPEIGAPASGATTAPTTAAPVVRSTAPASTTGATSKTGSQCPPPAASVAVSAVSDWVLLRRLTNISGRPEDDQVLWQATATVTNPTPSVVQIRSVVAVSITRGDGTKLLVRADPLTRTGPDRVHIGVTADTPAVDPGQTLPVHMTLRTRSGWGVATDNVYAHAEFESASGCFAQMTGVKPWETRPSNLPGCTETTNGSPCSR